jgi:hypothetical protein
VSGALESGLDRVGKLAGGQSIRSVEEGIWTVSGALESGLDRVGRLAGGQSIRSVV